MYIRHTFRLVTLLVLLAFAAPPAQAALKEWGGGLCTLGGNWNDPRCWNGNGGAPGVPEHGDGGYVRFLMPEATVNYVNPAGEQDVYSNFSLGSEIGGPIYFNHLQDVFALDHLNLGATAGGTAYFLAGTGELRVEKLLIGAGPDGVGQLFLGDGGKLVTPGLEVGKNGALDQSGGVLDVGQTISIGGDAGTTYSMRAGLTTAEWFYVNGGGDAVVDLSGGTFQMRNTFVAGRGPDGPTLAISGDAELTWLPGYVGSSGWVEDNVAYMQIGDGVLGPGRVLQSGNSLVSLGDLNIGGEPDIANGNVVGSQGYYEITGGTLESGEIVIGNYGEGTFVQDGGGVSVYKLECPQDQFPCDNFFWFPGHLRLGAEHSGEGSYDLRGGTLTTELTAVGEKNVGEFRQSGGTHDAQRLILSGAALYGPTADIRDSRATYFLTGGQLNTTQTVVGREGTGWTTGEGYFLRGGRFTQTGGTHTVAGALILGQRAEGDYLLDGYHALSTGSYFLTNGTLTTVNTVVGMHGEGLFRQTGGVHDVCELTIAARNLEAGSRYALEGGTLNAGVIRNNGTFEHLGGDLALGACEQGQQLFENRGTVQFASPNPVLVTGTFVNEGTLDTRDASVQFADLRLTPDSRVVARLGDPIIVTGTVKFDGVIDVVDPDGLATAGGIQLFDLRDGATKAGLFTGVNLPETKDGSDTCWDTRTLFTNGILSVRDRYTQPDACSSEVNHLPLIDAGPNVAVSTEAWADTVIAGTSRDRDGDPLSYRWYEGRTPLSDWSTVEEDQATLSLSLLQLLSAGDHNLTLVVSDGKSRVNDSMILTVGNSPPHAVASGGGDYDVGTEVVLAGEVSDFDGDTLNCTWYLDGKILEACRQEVATLSGGGPVALTPCVLEKLVPGRYSLTLVARDGTAAAVSSEVQVNVTDTGDPTLAPVASHGILWPPNHKMVAVSIKSNAADNSGHVLVDAVIASNEPEEGLGDDDIGPDWTYPVVDPMTGEITFDLRAERSGRGDGRVYTVTVTATDATGNSSQAELRFVVPHDQRKK